MEIIIFILTLFGLFIKWFLIAAAVIITGIVLSVLLEDMARNRANRAAQQRLEKDKLNKD